MLRVGPTSFLANKCVEHWDNAVEQGVYAARRLLTGENEIEPYAPTPWFWTDQFDRKIQLAGRTRPTDEVKIVTGSIEERRFAAAYGREGKLVGILGFNRPRHVMQYKQMITEGVSWEDALEHAKTVNFVLGSTDLSSNFYCLSLHSLILP